ncbi:acyloxyacyl hydrolase [Shewanella atlantica]|uniref:acyloxyacyl hydrolase n=1 Tax=Shewanella atlantica TaxID=271099 RepID=UPI003735C823
MLRNAIHFAITFILFTSLNVNATEKPSLSAGISTWGVLDAARLHSLVLNYEHHELSQLYGIKPTVIVMLGEQSHSYFAIGAAKYFEITPQLSFGIGFSSGYVNKTENLGYNLEFYSRAILNYELAKEQFMTLEVGHISNAGFSDKNPGSENVVLSYGWSF